MSHRTATAIAAATLAAACAAPALAATARTAPCGPGSQALVVRGGRAVPAIAAMRTLRFAVARGSAAERCLVRRVHPAVRPRAYDEVGQAVLALAARKVDAVLADAPTAARLDRVNASVRIAGRIGPGGGYVVVRAR
ncbi:MAG TPA: transporter substrate-binding domain-containing protein [Miltoncostaeaceae bacterium]|nr:transporter substrate-binding domain-containing protein [Miltoncostaeaceae bacterium]